MCGACREQIHGQRFPSKQMAPADFASLCYYDSTLHKYMCVFQLILATPLKKLVNRNDCEDQDENSQREAGIFDLPFHCGFYH